MGGALDDAGGGGVEAQQLEDLARLGEAVVDGHGVEVDDEAVGVAQREVADHGAQVHGARGFALAPARGAAFALHDQRGLGEHVANPLLHRARPGRGVQRVVETGHDAHQRGGLQRNVVDVVHVNAARQGLAQPF